MSSVTALVVGQSLHQHTAAPIGRRSPQECEPVRNCQGKDEFNIAAKTSSRSGHGMRAGALAWAPVTVVVFFFFFFVFACSCSLCLFLLGCVAVRLSRMLVKNSFRFCVCCVTLLYVFCCFSLIALALCPPFLREKIISHQFESSLPECRICHLPFPLFYLLVALRRSRYTVFSQCILRLL